MFKEYFLVVVLTFIFLFGYAQAPNQAESFMEKGITSYGKSNYADALVFFQNSVKETIKNDNFALQSKAYNNLANTYSQVGKSELALQNYHFAIAAAKKSNEILSIAKTYKNIGALYEEQKDLKSAMSYYDEAQILAIQLKNKSLQADCLNNKGIVYEQQLQYSKALAC